MVSQTSRALSVSVCLFVRAPYLSEALFLLVFFLKKKKKIGTKKTSLVQKEKKNEKNEKNRRF